MTLKLTIRNILPKSEFGKNAITLTFGTSIAQIFPIIFYPLLSRIFNPEDFGLLATLTSITGILAVLATGKYDQAILVAESKYEAANIIGLVLLISFILLSFFFILLQLFSNQLIRLFNEPELNKWLWYPPITAYAIIIFNCFNEWCVRNKYFTTLSWNKIVNAASHTLGKLLFGFIKVTGNGLVAGDCLGRAFSAATCVYRALDKDKDVFSKVSYNQIKLLSKKYINFPKYILPDQLINNLGQSIPVLFIGAFYSNTEVGYYSMAIQVLSVPISVISEALSAVFRQRANEDYIKCGSCLPIYKRLLLRMTLLGFFGTVSLLFVLPQLFDLVLGTQWKISGQYSQILLPMITLYFISMSLSGVFIVVRKMKISMYWQIYFTLITIISLILGFCIFKTLIATLLCFAIGRGSAYLLHIILSIKYADSNK